MKWIFCICIVCLSDLSLQQLHISSNPYRPTLDESNDYVGVLQDELSLEYKIDKMPSKTYDWSFVATGMLRLWFGRPFLAG